MEQRSSAFYLFKVLREVFVLFPGSDIKAKSNDTVKDTILVASIITVFQNTLVATVVHNRTQQRAIILSH